MQEGVQDYERGDPQILILGSSHARTFHVMGQLLARRTQDRVQVVSIAVEAGRLTSYAWVLQHRLRPLLEEWNASGELKRPNLRRFILTTEWWDDCAPKPGEVTTNLPSRAWVWRDFVDDARANGLTSYNLNYVQTRWRRLWKPSAIMQDRGQERIVAATNRLLRGPNPVREQEAYDEFLRYWQEMQEAGAACMGDSAQTAALRAILAYFHDRGVAVTIVLEPRKPSVITPRALAQTYLPFTAMMQRIARDYGAQVIDLSTGTPLLDSDFAADFDHITPAGNRKFAEWALDHDLRFLLEESAAGTPDSVPLERTVGHRR